MWWWRRRRTRYKDVDKRNVSKREYGKFGAVKKQKQEISPDKSDVIK